MSFLLLMLYLFCTIIRPQDWVPALQDKPLVSWLAIGTAVTVLIERMAAKDSILMKTPQNLFMFLLFFCVIMSHVTNTYLGGLTKSFGDFLVPFLLFFIVQNALNEKWKIWSAIWLIIIMVAVLVLQGMHQAKTGIGWAGQLPHVEGDGLIRVNWIGIFYDPNDLALIWVMSVGFLLPLIFGPTNFMAKLLALGLCGWMGYGVYLTNSRGGFLALLASIFYFFIRLTNKVVIGSVIGGVASMALMIFGPSRLSMIKADEASAYGRLELWYIGIRKMIHRPFFGVGHNMYMDDVGLTAHNSFVLAAAELGFIGLCVWVGLIYCSCTGLTKVYNVSEKYRSLSIGIQSALMGFCCAAFFLSRTYVILPYLLFALSGAVMYLAKEEHEELDFSLKGKDWRNIFLCSFGVILLVYILYKIGLR